MVYNQTERGVYAPGYYKDFKCIAGKCKHSCCVDWEICIDEETLEKYKKVENIIETVIESDEGACFKLTGDSRCPHLDESGLCKIIISHGEDYLSEICSNHPRFFNNVSKGRVEVGLGIVCEEACRLIIENEHRFSLDKIENEKVNFECDIEEFHNKFYPLIHRDKIILMIETFDGNFDKKIVALQKKFGIFDVYINDEWINLFLSLEILDLKWPKLLKSIKGERTAKGNISGSFYEKYFERLLIYFVYRYVSVAESLENLRARLAFAILSVQMIRCFFEQETMQSPEKLIDYARRYSAEIEYSDENIYEIIFELETKL